MALSTITYIGDGTTKGFSIPFEFLAEDDVKLYVDGVSTARTVNGSVVSVVTAPVSNAKVTVRRETAIVSRIVDFTNTALLTELDLDNSALQVFYAAQEARDAVAASIALNSADKFDALGKVVTNLADGADPTDAVTFGQLTAKDVAFAASLSASQASAAAADASKIAAGTSETNAAASAAAASTSKTNAGTSATNSAASSVTSSDKGLESGDWANQTEDVLARTFASGVGTNRAAGNYSAKHHAAKALASKTAAASSAAAGSTSEGAAATSATNSAASSVTSSDKGLESGDWANQTEDELARTFASGVGTNRAAGNYSAKHHAAKALASKTAAGVSETNSSNSETASASSATASASSATAADLSAAAAAASAAEGLYADVITVNFAASPFTVLPANDGDLFKVDTSGGAVVINLPSLTSEPDDFRCAIVKGTGDLNTVTATRQGTDTINGATTLVISAQYAGYNFVGDQSTLKYVAMSATAGNALLVANNLSDIGIPATARANLGVGIGTDVQAHSAVLDATTGTFLVADQTKLDGIEALADVTDVTNVTAAGALMKSELAGIAAVKATTGTFLVADQNKLDGIEAGATADQTSVTGNAATATTLQTARTINGVSFNGGANITLTLTPAQIFTAINGAVNPTWYRADGATGLYCQSYGGGTYMTDTTYLTIYGSKALKVNNAIVATGNITAYFSDMRLKTKTRGIESALGKVCSLDGFYYTHNALALENGYKDDGEHLGLSAQQVKKVAPELIEIAPFDVEVDEFDEGSVHSKSGEDYMTLDYANLVPLLVEAIKEQQETIVSLESRLAKLEKLLGE